MQVRKASAKDKYWHYPQAHPGPSLAALCRVSGLFAKGKVNKAVTMLKQIYAQAKASK